MLNHDSIFKFLFLLSIIVLIGNYLDAITTYYAIKYGNAREENYSMRYIIKNFGWGVFFIIKFVVATYFFLPVKYCLMNYPIKYLKRKIRITTKIVIIVIVILVYLYLSFKFWSVFFNNLKYIPKIQ